MRRIGRIFGKRRNRKQGKPQHRLAKHHSQFTPHLEALEERRLLAANILTLGFADADVVDGTHMELKVTSGSDSTVLALRVSAESGSPLDPAVPWIERLGGVSIAPIYSTHDIAGSTDSLFLAELGPGTYSITVKTEGGTAGLGRVNAMLPGDINGNGFVSNQEYMQASAAAVQDGGSWNSFTAQYYSLMGFDLGVNQYHSALDIDGNGHIDGFDLGNIYLNACVSVEVVATVTANDKPEFTPPAPDARIAEDSGSIDDIDLWDYVKDRETPDDELTFTNISSPHGTATLDAVDGHTVHFTPNANYNGTAEVTFSVTDIGENGAQANTETFTLDVIVSPVNDIPVVEATDTILTDEDIAVDIDLRTRVSDVETADGDLVFSVKNPTNGTVVLLDNGHTARFTPTANYNGQATFDFDVTDTGDNGAAAETVDFSVNINVAPVNDAPTPEAVAPVSVVEDNSITIDLRTRVDDDETADADLVFNLEDPATHATPATTVTAITGEGTLELLPNAGGNDFEVRFTPVLNFNGLAIFSFWATDDGSTPLTAPFLLAFSVTGTPDAPVADNDTYSVTEDEVLDENILANDTDPDPGDTLTASNITYISGNLVNFPPTVAADGSFTHDPRAEYQFLAVGESRQGVFGYTVSDGNGATDTAQVTITVTGVNDDPTAAHGTGATDADADTGGSLSGLVDDVDGTDTLTFSPTSATSTFGAAVTIDPATGAWTYDPTGVVALVALGDGETADDTFTYTVSDGNGGSSQNTVTITVTGVNDDPTAIHGTGATNADAITNGSLAGLVDDPDTSDTLTFALTGAAPLAAVGLNTASGAWTYDPTGVASFLALADGETADDTFTYTVSDGHGGTATQTVTITVTGVNDDPTAAPDTGSTNADATTSGSLAGLIDDPDTSDTLSFSPTLSTSTRGAAVTIDANTGGWTYDPIGVASLVALADGETADDTFTYTVSDGNGGSSQNTITITVTGVNDAPLADNDTYGITEDEVLNENILTNDDDPDTNDTLTASNITYISGDLVNFPPTVAADGSFTHDQRADYQSLAVGESRQGVFEYTVSDGNGGTDTAQVTITVAGANDAPTAVSDMDGTDEDSSVTIDVLLDDTDPDTNDTKTVQSVDTTGTQGTVANNGTDVAYDPNGAFEYLAVGESATDTFSYTMIDGQGAESTATVTVTINGANDAPTVEDQVFTVDSSDPNGVVVDTVAVDDPDLSDTHKFAITASDPVQGTTLFEIDEDTGDITALDTGALADGASFNLTVEVTDLGGAGLTNTATITINVIANRPPEAKPDEFATDEESIVPGNVLDDNGNSEDSDPDGDAISVITTGTDLSADQGGLYSLDSAGNMTYDPNGQFEYLGVGEFDTDSFNYTIQDVDGDTDSATVTVTIAGVNDAPNAGNDTDGTDEDSSVTIDVLLDDTDPDTNDTKTVQSVDTTGTQGTVTNNGTDVTYDPNGAFEYLAVGESATDTFSYTMIDGQGAESTATVTVTINGANDAPTALPDTDGTDEDNSVTIDVLLDDTDPDTNDTKTVQSVDTTGTQGTVANNGTDVAYDPNGAFEYLAVGESATDTFDYTMVDSQGDESTATVTVTITGINDAPVLTSIGPESLTDEETPLTFNITDLINSGAGTTEITDVDSSDTVGGIAVVGAVGNGTLAYSLDGTSFTDVVSPPAEDSALLLPFSAQIRYTPDGLNGETATLTYRAWDATNGNPGQTGVDTTANGGSTSFSSATDTFTLAVTGVNDAPLAVNPIGPIDKTYDGTPLADTRIDLRTVFDDPDGDTLTFTIDSDSSNPDLINVYVDGNDLVIEYAHDGYAANQDRTPADVTIKASDVIDNPGSPLSATDTFTVTVEPLQTGLVQLVALAAPTTNEEFDFFAANATSSSHIGSGRFQMDSSGSGPLAYSLFYLRSDGIDLDGTRTPTDPNDDVTALTFRDNLGNVIFDILADDDLQLDAAAGTVTGEWEDIGVNKTELYNGRLYVYAETPGGNFKVSGNDIKPSAEVLALPTSLTEVNVGDTYVVEIWVQDYYSLSTGLTAVNVDLLFDRAFSTASGTGTILDTPFNVLYGPGSIDNIAGEVSGIGGATVLAGVGLDPAYARLGYVEFTASAATGEQEYTLDVTSFLRQGAADLDPSQLVVNGVSVAQQDETAPETIPFTLLGANITVDGVIFGLDLQEQVSSSDQANLHGTVDAVVTYDAEDNPVSIQFVDANITVSNFEELLMPGIGGTAGSATANVGLRDATSAVNLAIRDMILGITSDQPIVLNGANIDQSNINFTATDGTVDYYDGVAPTTFNLDGRPLIDNGSSDGSLIEVAGKLELALPFIRDIDISGITGGSGDYLRFNGLVSGTYTVPALTATQTSPTAATAGQTDVVMTLSKSATALDTDGQVDTLPVSEAWIDEWDSYWVEIWARTGQGSGINAAGLDLAYNGDYFTAVELQHGRAFTENTTGDISTDGIVSALGGQAPDGRAATAGLGTDGFVLVGRVKFESLAEDQVPINSVDRVIGPHELGLKISNMQIDVEGVDEPQIVHAAAPETELWAVPYDVDDNDRIDLGDLAFFAQAYHSDILQSDTPFVWASDYDKSGNIDLGDLSFFASNYRRSKAGDSDIAYPASFLQRWIGSGIDTEGDSAVHEVLEAAVETWREKLGLDQPIDIQLVVKDFGSSQLGEGQIIEVDEAGRPVKGRITLDDDAAGMGWYSQLDGDPAESRYDLYTVILHEVGHTLGFTRQYDGFADNVQSDDQGGLTFVGADFTAQLDDIGQHLDAAAHPGVVMNSTLSPGVRRLPSDLTVEMLKTAYASATVGGGGFAAIGAAMHAHAGLPAQPAALFADTISTADFSPFNDRLDGDVTWDRMFGENGDRLDSIGTQSIDQAILDTVIDDISRGDFDGEATESSEITRFAAADFALHTHDDLAIERLSTKNADDQNIFDAIFGDWQEPLG